MYFIDSSALVKAYLVEKGSGTVQSTIGLLGGSAASAYVSPLVACETLGVLTKALRKGEISKAVYEQLRADLDNDLATRLAVLPLTPMIYDEAFRLIHVHRDRGPGGADVVHVASAHALQLAFPGRTVGFMCSDDKLGALARAEHFEVFDPETDPLSSLLLPD